MRVPFNDLRTQYHLLAPALKDAVERVAKTATFINGPDVSEFESEWSSWVGHPWCVGCANGTDAIYIILKCLGIGPGDEVITTAHSWISTAEAVTQCGATPVFVDVDDYFHLDPHAAERAINSRTRAILGVHLFGQLFDAPALQALAAQHDLHLVEDAAQAHGATLDGLTPGSWGAAASFSFYPGKNLGAWGDAGAIVTRDKMLSEAFRVFARHGGTRKNEHLVPGINSRLDTLQAAILRAKLPHLESWIARRRSIAEHYLDAWRQLHGLRLPATRPGAQHAWHLFVVRSADRNELRRHLAAAGIETGLHYPRAIPCTQAYRESRHHGIDHSIQNQESMLSLPLFPEMTDSQVEHVVDSVIRFFHPPPG